MLPNRKAIGGRFMKNHLAVVTLAALVNFHGLDSVARADTKSSRSDYTKEQQRKLLAEGLKSCRNKIGPTLHSVSVDYKKKRYNCFSLLNSRAHIYVEWGNPAFLK